MIDTVGQRVDPKLQQGWEASIWAGASSPDADPLAGAVDSAVLEIESLCRPHLRSGRAGGRERMLFVDWSRERGDFPFLAISVVLAANTRRWEAR